MEPVEFVEDIPFPTVNIIIYKEIFYLETWLRRILLTSLSAKDGEHWFKSVPLDIQPEVKKRRDMLRGRIYLGSEDNSNLLWLLTIEELKKCCTHQDAWPFIKKMTGFNEREFIENMELLRKIRNIIGHNRATTEKTLALCKLSIEYFRKGIKVFRDNMGLVIPFAPGATYEEILEGEEADERFSQTEFYKEFVNLIPHYDDEWKNSFNFWEGEYFRGIQFDATFWSMGGERIDVFEVLKIFTQFERYILAFLIYAEYESFSVIYPKSIPIEKQKDIFRIFVESQPKIWTEKEPYINQSPRFLSDPKIWFITEYDVPRDVVDKHRAELEGILFGNVITFPKPG